MIEQMSEHESHAGEKAEFSHCPKGPVGPDAGERSECVGAAPVREGKDGSEGRQWDEITWTGPENGLDGPGGNQRVRILGRDYRITRCSGSSDPRMKDSDGFCDDTTREICAETFERYAGRPNAKKDLREYSKKVLRHEIIHAFLCESGLAECSAWAQDEEAVDWFARQGPKIIQAWKEAGAL